MKLVLSPVSIPTEFVSVKSLYLSALSGLPVSVHGNVLHFSAEASLEELDRIPCCLEATNRASLALSRLWRGDWWNHISGHRGSSEGSKKQYIATLIAQQGERVYQQYKVFGCVAARWAGIYRTQEVINCGWTFLLNNYPDTGLVRSQDRQKKSNVSSLTYLRTEETQEGYWVYVRASNGREYRVLLPDGIRG